MKMISFDMIKGLHIAPEICYEWAAEMVAKKNDTILPAKISMKPEAAGVFINTMPVTIPQSNLAGIKVVTRYPDRIPSLDSQILLYRLDTGENIALMDGTWITAMRTGGVAAHSIRLFAKRDYHTIGIMGLGNTARAVMKVLLALEPDRELKIKLKAYKDQHMDFATAFSDFHNITFENCDTYEQVVTDSDVVISAVTVMEHNLCEDKCFKKGVLVVPVHTRGFMNCDLFFDKIVADDRAHVEGFQNFEKFRYFAEVTDVVNGICNGRETEEERILAYNIGISAHDIYFAGKIYEMLKDIGEEISLNSPKEKFWL